ncbi:MAG: hypothetical protein LUH47_00250 [Clostridiales bacterium]|nr:hypothetical protein [Clostridiales bacterium]
MSGSSNEKGNEGKNGFLNKFGIDKTIACAAVVILIIGIFIPAYGEYTFSFYDLNSTLFGMGYIIYMAVFALAYLLLQFFDKKKLSVIGIIGCVIPFVMGISSIQMFIKSFTYSVNNIIYLLALILMVVTVFLKSEKNK